MSNLPYISLYDILGVKISASVEDVRRAYKRKLLETHPDKLSPGATEEEKLIAEAEFRKVYNAFEILSDPDQRQAYNVRLYRERWPSSEDLDRRKKEREQWAQEQERRHRARMEAIRKKRESDRLAQAQEAETVANLVNEMVDALNKEIPGWLERKQKVQQMKAARELRARQASQLI